ncbi:MAG: 6-phosphofructokinase [Chloroflexaceae bacterium]|nr:6-phosphofructokinase [Chloroflexaceae bacterium]
MTTQHKQRLAVMTSGGDAPGMNAALRAVVRTAIDKGAEVYAIFEGYQGMVKGGDFIRQMYWDDVGGILHRGGTIIGTARSTEFRTREGRRTAARNLLLNGIDRLVVIGGDGSLTGANLFREEWAGLLAELVERGEITSELATLHPYLYIVGLVGSIDNDMFGTDMTIGTDTALHRITEAIDAISSTASSHQRSFVVEVMGRNCGYLALMSALATEANWVFIPENPPEVDNWEDVMCQALGEGRKAGRRDSIVIVAEGACDTFGNPIKSEYVKKVLEDRLGEDTRVTILGHVQRGGSPSAFDRNLSTLSGYAAVEEILKATPESEAKLIGIINNRITASPLMYCVQQTHAIANAINQRDFQRAMELRGKSFCEAFETLRTLVRGKPRPSQPGQRRLRIGILNTGGAAPGMNTAARAAVRYAIDRGHIMYGIRNGFRGLIDGDLHEMDWMSVEDWTAVGGAELGTTRVVPSGSELYAIARNLEEYQLNALLVIGGSEGYQTIHRLSTERTTFPAFNIPMVCLPATINNDLPGSELSIGADTALNSIVEVVDKIKQSAVASRRCFVVEVMGRYCGYLALMSGMATGAERVYMHEEGVTIKDLQADLEHLIEGFRHGKRLGLIIRNEKTHAVYSTSFMAELFATEGRGIFEVRHAILGHLQQGGNPTPFDRIQATRMAKQCVDYLLREAEKPLPEAAFLGKAGTVSFYSIAEWPRMINVEHDRPRQQWWYDLYVPIARALSKPAPATAEISE